MEFILLCFMSVINGIFVSNYVKCYIKVDLKLLVSTVIVVPLLEEALFRNIFKYLLKDISYGTHINVLLFGLAHVSTYYYFKSILVTIIKCVAATYLGYCLDNYDILLHSFLIHATLNLISSVTVYVITFFMYYEDENCADNISSSCRDDIKIKRQHNFDSLFFRTYCPRTCVDDINIGRKRFIRELDYRSISRNNMNKSLRDSIDNLTEINMRRRI